MKQKPGITLGKRLSKKLAKNGFVSWQNLRFIEYALIIARHNSVFRIYREFKLYSN